MFPGQGSFEPGMGRDIAEAEPEAMAVYDEGSAASGPRSAAGFASRAPLEELVRDRAAAAGAAWRPALRSTPRFARAGSVPTTSSAIRSASSPRSAPRESIALAEAIALVRERGLAMAAAAKERPGSMAAILGLADDVVETLCRKIANVWPANYNCPGQLVISGETAAVDECCSRGRSARARAARCG